VCCVTGRFSVQAQTARIPRDSEESGEPSGVFPLRIDVGLERLPRFCCNVAGSFPAEARFFFFLLDEDAAAWDRGRGPYTILVQPLTYGASCATAFRRDSAVALRRAKAGTSVVPRATERRVFLRRSGRGCSPASAPPHPLAAR